MSAQSGGLVAPPLRILFCASAPLDPPVLDYEKEEEAILRITDWLGGKVHLDIVESGTFDEIGDRVSSLKPHVVHLSGHGVMQDGVGHFAFEASAGGKTRTMAVRGQHRRQPRPRLRALPLP